MNLLSEQSKCSTDFQSVTPDLDNLMDVLTDFRVLIKKIFAQRIRKIFFSDKLNFIFVHNKLWF